MRAYKAHLHNGELCSDDQFEGSSLECFPCFILVQVFLKTNPTEHLSMSCPLDEAQTEPLRQSVGPAYSVQEGIVCCWGCGCLFLDFLSEMPHFWQGFRIDSWRFQPVDVTRLDGHACPVNISKRKTHSTILFSIILKTSTINQWLPAIGI